MFIWWYAENQFLFLLLFVSYLMMIQNCQEFNMQCKLGYLQSTLHLWTETNATGFHADMQPPKADIQTLDADVQHQMQIKNRDCQFMQSACLHETQCN